MTPEAADSGARRRSGGCGDPAGAPAGMYVRCSSVLLPSAAPETGKEVTAAVGWAREVDDAVGRARERVVAVRQCITDVEDALGGVPAPPWKAWGGGRWDVRGPPGIGQEAGPAGGRGWVGAGDRRRRP